MKTNLINLIFIVIAYSVTACPYAEAAKSSKEKKNTKIHTHSNVLLLDSNNFDQALKTFDHLLVDFYLPYCKTCNNVLRSELGHAAIEWGDSWQELRNTAIAKMDMSKGDNYKIALKYKICDYPSIKLFKDGGRTGKIIDYEGKHNSQRIQAWLKKKTEKSQTTRLDSAKSVNGFLYDYKRSSDKYAAIGYFSNIASNNAKEFLETSEDGIAGLQFGITTDNTIFKGLKVNDGDIVLHHPELTNPIIFPSRTKKIENKAHLEVKMLPLLRDFVEYSSEMGKLKDLTEDHIFIATSFSSENLEKEKEMLKKVATDYLGKVLFVLVDMDERLQLYGNILTFLDIHEAPAIGLASIRQSGALKFKPKKPDEISEKNIREFLDEYFIEKMKDENKTKDEL